MSWELFKERVFQIHSPKIVEFGTRRYGQDPSHRQSEFPGAQYLKADFQAGVDVDLVCDLHSASDTLGVGVFDVVIARSVFEHVKKPWIAAEEILKILKPGGLFFVSTHQTFPVHGYPEDHFRFSDKALDTLFEGASERHPEMTHPCKIIPDPLIEIWDHNAPAFIHAVIWGSK